MPRKENEAMVFRDKLILTFVQAGNCDSREKYVINFFKLPSIREKTYIPDAQQMGTWTCNNVSAAIYRDNINYSMFDTFRSAFLSCCFLLLLSIMKCGTAGMEHNTFLMLNHIRARNFFRLRRRKQRGDNMSERTEGGIILFHAKRTRLFNCMTDAFIQCKSDQHENVWRWIWSRKTRVSHW